MKSTRSYTCIEVSGLDKDTFFDKRFADHLTFKSMFTLKYELETLSPVRVGGRFEFQGNDIVLSTLRHAEGKLIVPGSTIKGVVRTNLLAVSDDTSLLSKLFGSTKNGALAGRVFLSYLSSNKGEPEIHKIPRMFNPRPCIGVKIYKTDLPGLDSTNASYNVECIPPNSKLTGSAVIYNAKEEEVGAILSSLGVGVANEVGVFKLGYGKPFGMGKVKPVIDSFELHELSFKGLSLASETRDIEPFISKFFQATGYEARKERWKKVFLTG
jgi:hypothetical protein